MRFQKKILVVMAAAVGIALMGMGGCNKNAQPAKTQSMEGMTRQAMPAVEEANKTAAAATASVEQTTCPVMEGNKIDKNVFVEYKGKKVYFCCAACKAEFEKNPEKYIAKLPQFAK